MNLISREDYRKICLQLEIKACYLCNLKFQIVIKKFKSWTWIANKAPYVDYHTMLIPKRHIRYLSEISAEEWEQFRQIYPQIVANFKQADFKFRSGDQVKKLSWLVRSRDDSYDHSEDIPRPEHLHIHVFAEPQGFYDPILQADSYTRNGWWKSLE